MYAYAHAQGLLGLGPEGMRLQWTVSQMGVNGCSPNCFHRTKTAKIWMDLSPLEGRITNL